MRFKSAVAATSLAVAALLAGCSIDGTAIREPVRLDTGEFGGRQGKAFSTPDEPTRQARARALRLTDHLVLREEVDARLTVPTMPTYPFAVIEQTRTVSSKIAVLPEMRSLRYGATMAGRDEDDLHSINVAVYVMADEAAASAAAEAMTRAFLADRDLVYEETSIPGTAPQARVVRRNGSGRTSLVAFTPIGDTVMYAWASVEDEAKDPGWAARTVVAATDKQRTLLTEMPDDEVSDVDPDDMIRLTVDPRELGDPTLRSVSGPRGQLMYTSDQLPTLAAMTKAGVDAVARNETTVVRAATASQADEYRKFLLEDYRTSDETARISASPQDLSAATCLTGRERTACFVAVDRYVAYAYDEDEKSARQLISAAYGFIADRTGK